MLGRKKKFTPKEREEVLKTRAEKILKITEPIKNAFKTLTESTMSEMKQKECKFCDLKGHEVFTCPVYKRLRGAVERIYDPVKNTWTDPVLTEAKPLLSDLYEKAVSKHQQAKMIN